MPNFRPRFTVRRLMVAVAVVGGCLGLNQWLKHRAEQFRKLGWFHRNEIVCILSGTRDENGKFHYTPMDIDQNLKPVTKLRQRIDAWHEEMAQKYWDAARHPWLPVAPDPPEPK